MENIYNQDWHIHSLASYDGYISMEELLRRTKEYGITQFGITDHISYPYMMEHIKAARRMFDTINEKVPGFHFGIELSTISANEIAYSRKFHFDDSFQYFYLPGYTAPENEGEEAIDFGMSKEQMEMLHVEYAIGAAHFVIGSKTDRKSLIRNWHAQQMFCATDSRVDIVGHSWWCPYFPGFERLVDKNGLISGEPWFDDFKVIPQSMHDEFAAALLENGKCAEMNISFFSAPMYTEQFKYQYAEYIRSLFEKGVPITIGTDCHGDYIPGVGKGKYSSYQDIARPFLTSVGFKAEDFATPKFRTYEGRSIYQ